MSTVNSFSPLFRNRSVRTLVLSALALVFASWYRVAVAGSVMVDGHSLSGLPELVVFVLFLSSLFGFSISYYQLWKANELDNRSVKLLAFLLAILFSFMVPMLSNDIFTYLTFGGASNLGIDVYTDPLGIHASPYFAYLSPLWVNSPCAYGPVALAVAKLAAWAGAGTIGQALAAYKLLNLLFAFVFIELVFRVGALLKVSNRNLLFIVLNPVLLLQGVGQFHSDILAITFVITATYFLLSNQWYLAFIVMGLCVAAKMNYILMLPFLLVVLFLQKKNLQTFFTQLILGLVLFIGTVVLAYYPFYTSTATFTVPFNYHFNQNPSKCIAEILGDILYFAPQLFGGNSNELHNTVNAVSGLPDRQLIISNAIVKVCQLLALSMCAFILFKFWVSKRELRNWFRAYTRCLLLFLLFYLHIFNPWYLMMVLPFLFIDDDPKFMHWLFALTCFVNVQDIVCSISRDSIVYYVELVLTFASVMLYIWRFRTVYIRSLRF